MTRISTQFSALLLVFFALNASHAATLTWNNGQGNMAWNTTATNWSGTATWNNTTPDSVVFGSTGAGLVTLGTGITFRSITFNSPGYTIAGNTLTLSGSLITNNADAVISSAIAGSSYLWKYGAGTLTLSGNNTASAGLSVEAGTLVVNSLNAIGSGYLAVVGSTFRYTGTGAETTSRALWLDRVGAGTFDLTQPTGDLTMNATGGLISMGLIKQGPGALTLGGSTVITGGGVTVNGGVLTLTAANTYSGATVVNAGILQIGNDSALGTTNSGITVNTNATLDLNGYDLGFKPVTLNGGSIAQNAGGNAYEEAVNVMADSFVSSTGYWMWLGSVTGPGKLTFNVANGVWNDGGDWTNTGGITLQAGEIDLYAGAMITGGPVTIEGGLFDILAAEQIGNALPVTVNGGELHLFNLETIGSLAGAGGVILLDNTLATGGNNASTTNASAITGVGSLVKTGTGTMTLAGTNDYMGATTVSNGTLVVNGSLATNVVTVVGGTLGGTGTVNGSTTLAGGGTLSPGAAAIGTLSFASTLSLSATSTNVLRISKNGSTLTADKVNLTGASGLAYNGSLLVVSNAGSDAFLAGDKFTLFARAAGSFSGSFVSSNLPPLGAGLSWSTAGLNVDGSIQVLDANTVATPSSSPAPGIYSSAQTVTIFSATPGATIYYTTNGVTPTTNSPSGASGLTISVPAGVSLTLQALATRVGMANSAVASGVYQTYPYADTPYLVGSIAAVSNVFYVDGLAIYQFSTSEIPTSVLPADAPERYVYFGSPMAISFSNAVPGAHYRIDAVFSSDGARTEAPSLNGSSLGPAFTLAAQSLTNNSWDCGTPNASALNFQLAAQSGPNAVLSSLKIYSSDPTMLTLPPTNVLTIIPRLSPLPVAVTGISNALMSFNGPWQFQAAAPAGFPTNASGSWSAIQVPGEWVMQGFTVGSGVSAAYRRTFVMPADWSGARVKACFDAVYSSCNVWVNEMPVGSHLGGFTPFELDITSAVHAGTNWMELTVVNESIADTLASGSQYAMHQLGGISRKVTIFAAPALNVASLHVLPQVATNLSASAEVRLSVANESPDAVTNAVALVELCPIIAGVTSAPVAQVSMSLPSMAAGETAELTQLIPVPSPRLWHPEKPNLYVARVALQQDGATVENAVRRFGLRRVEIVGNQIFVNNIAVKLAGVCRHETQPWLGRSLSPEWWALDAQRFLEMNVNFVRTSHYPPAEEFIDQCDERGLFVEEEAPLCWADGTDSYIVSATMEMANRDLSHPSIIYWSLGNESTWGSAFASSGAALRQFDPTRPQTFEYSSGSLIGNPALDIQAVHYPYPSATTAWANNPQPVTFGEYSHLYDYDHTEILTDPGLRDFWGPYHEAMWNDMWQSQAILGGSIWAAIDDTFFIPQADGTRIPVGYGSWGPIDGWRRAKPEFLYVRRGYSPLRLLTTNLPAGGVSVTLQVQNRQNVTALNELIVDYAWLDAGEHVNGGQVTNLLRLDPALCNAAPGTNGSITIPTAGAPVNRQLYVRWSSPRGFVMDEWLVRETPVTAPQPPATGTGTVTDNGATITLCAGNSAWVVSKSTGSLTQQTTTNGATVQTIALTGPMLLLQAQIGEEFVQFTLNTQSLQPSSGVATNWALTSVYTTNSPSPGVVIRGSYTQASGSYTLMPTNGGLRVSYDFILSQSLTPRQMGLVFELPADCVNLTWQRDAELDVYPADHIGRPFGQAVATDGFPAGILGPTNPPAHPWSMDLLPQGNNDFRSTKRNIRNVTLANATGAGVEVFSDGNQSSRAWMENSHTRLLIADFNNGGAVPFFYVELPPSPTYGSGTHVVGSVFLAATATPGIGLTSPTGGSMVIAPASIPLAASVTNNGQTITQVRYYNNGTNLVAASGIMPDFSAAWTGAPPGSYNLTAVAAYGASGSVTSAPVAITVLGIPTITAGISGGQLTLHWPVENTGWRLETQTNALSVGLNGTWHTVSSSDASNVMTLPVDTKQPAVFYRLVSP